MRLHYESVLSESLSGRTDIRGAVSFEQQLQCIYEGDKNENNSFIDDYG